MSGVFVFVFHFCLVWFGSFWPTVTVGPIKEAEDKWAFTNNNVIHRNLPLLVFYTQKYTFSLMYRSDTQPFHKNCPPNLP